MRQVGLDIKRKLLCLSVYKSIWCIQNHPPILHLLTDHLLHPQVNWVCFGANFLFLNGKHKKAVLKHLFAELRLVCFWEVSAKSVTTRAQPELSIVGIH